MNAAKLAQSSLSQHRVDPDTSDVWDVQSFGFSAQPAGGDRQLNFTPITQPWLRQAAKQFIRYTLATLSAGTARSRLSALKRFSEFLNQFYPNLQPQAINRAVIVHYLSYLVENQLSPAFRTLIISSLKTFLYWSTTQDWAALPRQTLILPGDYPHQKKRNPGPFQLLSLINYRPTWNCCHCLTATWFWCY